MEAPKKIYLYPSDRTGEEYEDKCGTFPCGENCVEYIRTDTFIEKACEWLESVNLDFYQIISRQLVEDFKKYMEE